MARRISTTALERAFRQMSVTGTIVWADSAASLAALAAASRSRISLARLVASVVCIIAAAIDSAVFLPFFGASSSSLFFGTRSSSAPSRAARTCSAPLSYSLCPLLPARRRRLPTRSLKFALASARSTSSRASRQEMSSGGEADVAFGPREA